MKNPVLAVGIVPQSAVAGELRWFVGLEVAPEIRAARHIPGLST